MRPKFLILVVIVSIFLLTACGGENVPAQSTLAAPIYKDVEPTTEITLYDQVIFDIEDVSGEITITDGTKSHTIEVQSSILMEQNFDANNPTILTFVNYDGLQICFIERKDDRMHAAFENHVNGVSCDTNYMKLEVSGKWDVISNTTNISFDQDYNVVIHLPRKVQEEVFTAYNEDGNVQEIEIKQISLTSKNDEEIATFFVTFEDTTICTIEAVVQNDKYIGSSISGESEKCDIPILSDFGFEVTIPGYFNLE